MTTLYDYEIWQYVSVRNTPGICRFRKTSVLVQKAAAYFLGVAVTLILAGLWPSPVSAIEARSDPVIISEPTQTQQLKSPQGLSAALQAVMKRHPAVKGKRFEVNARQFAIDSAKASRFPSVAVEANNLNNNYDQSTIQLSQPLWTFGKINTGIQLAKANYRADQIELLQVQRELIEKTAAAYAMVEGIKQRLDVALINIDEHEQLHQQIKRRQAGQLASVTDERLAHSRIIQARAQYIQIQGELRIALAELKSLTQIKVETDLPVDRSLAELPSLAEVEALALKNSAATAFKRELRKVAQLNIKREKVAYLPTVYGRIEHNILDIPANTDRTYAGFVLEGNLEGLGFAARGRIKGAAAYLNATGEDLNSTINDVRQQVYILMSNRDVQHTLIDSQKEAVTIVEATLASFIRQYESGRKTWLEVLNIQRELTELRFQLVQIESEWLILSLRIIALTGGLDQYAGIKS